MTITEPTPTPRRGTRRRASCARSTAGSRCASTGRPSRGCAATRRTPRSQGYTCEKGAAPRPLPERSAPADHAAASPARRHVRGDRLGHGDRRDRGALPGRDRRARRRQDPLLRRRRPGQPSRRRLRRRDHARRSASRTRSNALAQEKTGEFWVDGQLFGTSRCHTDRRLRARPGRRVLGQEPVAVARLPAGTPDPQGDRQRPEPHADRRRPAAHRVGRPRRHPPAPACPVATPTCWPPSWRCSSRSGLLADDWLAEHANGLDEVLDHICARRHRRVVRAAPASTRPRCARRLA